MKLSVMFITHNRKYELCRAIKSCLENKIENMEFIIVDNNSNDGTEIEVRNLLDKSAIDYTYYFSENNMGVAGGRNKGFSLCRGEYIFCLDDDAILVTEDFFDKSCKFMDDNKEVGALAYNIYEPETNRQLIGVLEKDNEKSIKKCLSFLGGAHTIRRNIFGMKLYPQNLFFGAEELYASHIVWNKGYKVIYNEHLIVHHLPSKINRTDGKKRDYNFILNQWLVRILTYPKVYWPLLTLLLMLRLIKNNMFNWKYFVKIKKDFKLRYDKEERNKIHYSTINKLIIYFGIKKIF